MLWLYFFVVCQYIHIAGSLSCQISTNGGQNVVVKLHHTLILNCPSINNGNKTAFKWSKDNQELNCSKSIFTKHFVTQRDAGRYNCSLIQNNQTKESCSVIVHVDARPIVYFGICEELQGTMILECIIETYSKPNVTWFKDGKKLTLGTESDTVNYYVNNATRVNNGIKQYISILKKYHPVKTDASGLFGCVAENENEKTSFFKMMNCEIVAKCAEFDEKNAVNIVLHVGDTTTLSCKILFYNNRIVSYNDGFGFKRINNTNGDNHVLTTNATNISPIILDYTIFNATKNDSGTYECTYWSTQNLKCTKLKKYYYVTVKAMDGPFKDDKLRHKKNVYVVVAVSLAGCLIGFALVVLFHWMRKRRLHLNILRESSPELNWDVFISYSSDDFLWVKKLCSILEEPPFNLVVCLHHRDWELGKAIIDNMIDSVYCSRKTLIVVSKSYLRSSYCMQELQIAMHSELGQKDRIILLKIDDVSMNKLPRALRQKSFLDFSDSEQLKYFKTKLIRALPQRETIDVIPTDHGGNDGDHNNDDDVLFEVNNQFELEEIALV